MYSCPWCCRCSGMWLSRGGILYPANYPAIWAALYIHITLDRLRPPAGRQLCCSLKCLIHALAPGTEPELCARGVGN